MAPGAVLADPKVPVATNLDARGARAATSPVRRTAPNQAASASLMANPARFSTSEKSQRTDDRYFHDATRGLPMLTIILKRLP